MEQSTLTTMIPQASSSALIDPTTPTPTITMKTTPKNKKNKTSSSTSDANLGVLIYYTLLTLTLIWIANSTRNYIITENIGFLELLKRFQYKALGVIPSILFLSFILGSINAFGNAAAKENDKLRHRELKADKLRKVGKKERKKTIEAQEKETLGETVEEEKEVDDEQSKRFIDVLSSVETLEAKELDNKEIIEMVETVDKDKEKEIGILVKEVEVEEEDEVDKMMRELEIELEMKEAEETKLMVVSFGEKELDISIQEVVVDIDSESEDEEERERLEILMKEEFGMMGGELKVEINESDEKESLKNLGQRDLDAEFWGRASKMWF